MFLTVEAEATSSLKSTLVSVLLAQAGDCHIRALVLTPHLLVYL